MNLIYSSAIGEIKTITNSYQTISCEGCKINTRFESEQEKELLVLDYQLSHKNWVWRQLHKVFERVFKISVDFGWVQINKKLDYVDWRDYGVISIFIKGSGKPSGIDFSITEEDGDAWYYFDKESLTSEDWVEIRMPFEDFVNPKWASHGNGKKEFKNVTQIAVTITNFDRPIENTLYFETFDGDLFKLA
ncbi:MAG: CIA30 family protein [Candidatus Omnitrophota bacterium]|nr:CIA30 family protein [Candidatus Omnitrophota bacterium]